MDEPEILLIRGLLRALAILQGNEPSDATGAVLRGGPGSGYDDPHYGRPGEVGGSLPRDAGPQPGRESEASRPTGDLSGGGSDSYAQPRKREPSSWRVEVPNRGFQTEEEAYAAIEEAGFRVLSRQGTGNVDAWNHMASSDNHEQYEHIFLHLHYKESRGYYWEGESRRTFAQTPKGAGPPKSGSMDVPVARPRGSGRRGTAHRLPFGRTKGSKGYLGGSPVKNAQRPGSVKAKKPGRGGVGTDIGGETIRTVDRGGPGSGHHGHRGRPGKAVVEVQREINRYGAEVKKIGDVRTFGYANGVYKGEAEPSINMEYVGNGEMLESIRTKAKEWNQDSAIVYGPELSVGKDSAAGTVTFSSPPDKRSRDQIGKVLMDNGIDGWTWAKVDGKPALVVVGIPQFGVTPRTYERAVRGLTSFLKGNRIEHRLNERRLKVAVAAKDTDYQWH